MGKSIHEQNQKSSRKNFPILCGCLILSTMALNLVSVSVYAQSARAEEPPPSQPGTSAIPINVSSIVYLTFAHNPEVVSARYALEAAEFQFKDFERDLSQFTPLLLRSSIERDERPPDEGQEYTMRAGMEKEFFDGSSIFAGVGHRGEFGDIDGGRGQFLEADIQFPLFGSNTTLRRITARSREENEMYNARLEYIDTIRDAIQESQENYFSLLQERETMSVRAECASDYKEILAIPRIQSNPSERRQMEDEIQSLQSEILEAEEDIKSKLLSLQFSIGLEHLLFSRVGVLDMYAEDYYGKSYLTLSKDELLREARKNDIKIRVLENAKENSIEKKRLAERGQWDIFVDLNGQYDLGGSGGLRDENGYLMSIGFRVKKIDSTLLNYSLRRAQAEIRKYETLIRGQRLRTKYQIDKEWLAVSSERKQCVELFKSVESRRSIYLQKREDYTAGKESIDNLITSRKNLMETQMGLLYSLGGFYESITKLDQACGVCFAKLGIQL